ncbi:MAG: hypothetical protein ACTSU5_04905, partial [Promethearchaeota archaeon]
YLIFDFDVGGYFYHDNDVGTYEEFQVEKIVPEGKIFSLTQADDSGYFVGIATHSRPSSYEVFDPTGFIIDSRRRHLANLGNGGPADLGLAMEWNIPRLEPGTFFQVPVMLFAGDEETDREATITGDVVRLPRLYERFKRVNNKLIVD